MNLQAVRPGVHPVPVRGREDPARGPEAGRGRRATVQLGTNGGGGGAAGQPPH